MADSTGPRDGVELPDRMVADTIMRGADAASYSVLERGGEQGYIIEEGREALATFRFRPTSDAEPRTRVWPLTFVLMAAAHGATIEEVAAPDPDRWTWTAAAYVVAERTLPAGLILPEPLRRRWLWLLAARDDRGMSGVLYSQDRSLSRYGPLGKVLADQVARTTILGALGRQAQARRGLRPEDDFAAVIAGTVAEYFSTPAAMTGADGGQALLAYEISSFDPVVRTWQTYASYPPEPVQPARSRRAALSDRSLRALELEVWGARHTSKKSMAQLVSLDAPTDGDDSADSATVGETLAGSDDTARTVEQRLELGELVARSGLSKGEREVVGLKAQDHSEVEIAAILSLSRGSVTSLWTRARRKMIEAAKEEPQVM